MFSKSPNVSAKTSAFIRGKRLKCDENAVFSSKTMWFTRNLRVYDLFSGDFLCSSLLGKPSLQVSCYVGKSPSYNSLVNGMFYPSLYQVPQFGIAKLVHLTPITVGFMVDINQTNHQFITGGAPPCIYCAGD